LHNDAFCLFDSEITQLQTLEYLDKGEFEQFIVSTRYASREYSTFIVNSYAMNIEEVIQRYHAAADEFSRGDSLPVKAMFSHRDDVSLANPFGPIVTGWRGVSEALDFASSRFRDGKVNSFEQVVKYESTDLTTILEVERWEAKVSGRQDISSFVLRVTSTFRNENSEWKLVHRHADPISSFSADGPLRTS
jgi:hypothetical protein